MKDKDKLARAFDDICGEVDCSIHAVGELWIAAQEWPPSETGDGLVQIDSV